MPSRPVIKLPNPRPLTRREVEALLDVAAGLTTEAAASLRGISPNTIRIHRSRCLQKLGAANMEQAIAHAIRAKLIR
jgi:DNA-binding NarL/FixJ family response regulator